MNVIDQAKTAAAIAAELYLHVNYGGADDGPCGFAWVDIIPVHKGNTKAGRAERAVLREMGFELDWTEKKFSMWNPSRNPCQCMDAKFAGAKAAALILVQHGFNAVPACRYD
jgi:hypothetical protein